MNNVMHDENHLDVVRDGRVLDSSASIGLFVLIEAEATDM